MFNIPFRKQPSHRITPLCRVCMLSAKCGAFITAKTLHPSVESMFGYFLDQTTIVYRESVQNICLPREQLKIFEH